MNKLPLLHYTVSGHGSPVVLLHGYLASASYWSATIAEMESQHTVYALDLLGFGKSPKPGRSRYDVEAQERSIQATIEAIGITPFTLIGHSMGSLIALHYARRHPASVKKLVLTNMPVFADRQQAMQDIYATSLAYRLGLHPVLHRLIWPLFVATIQLRLLPRQLSRSLRSKRHYLFQSNAASRLRSMRNLIFQAKVEADLMALEVKTTIISGLSDRAIYHYNLRRYQLSDQVESFFVEGGHHLPHTNPRLIADFA